MRKQLSGIFQEKPKEKQAGLEEHSKIMVK
jgi:hypothetical protein